MQTAKIADAWEVSKLSSDGSNAGKQGDGEGDEASSHAQVGIADVISPCLDLELNRQLP